MTSILPEVEYPMEPFQWCLPTLLRKFDVSSFSVTGDIWIFKLVILLTLSSSKLIFILLTLDKWRLTLFALFYYFGQVRVILLSLSKTCHEKQAKKTQEPRTRSGTSYFQWRNGIQKLVSSINRLQRLSFLFLSVTWYSDFCDKIKHLW